ncbi:hypothetical protein LTR84_008419 [Exophiala bonariae]|uniref:Pre-mRNA-splicing factor CWC24 n=1 Tax=Exophiala bonariae TaxID=1690606 RepID=A0AAV9MXI7_9EURO|nr:hypothetical protein LTR84_008419 [Exophiala bonariae]
MHAGLDLLELESRNSHLQLRTHIGTCRQTFLGRMNRKTEAGYFISAVDLPSEPWLIKACDNSEAVPQLRWFLQIVALAQKALSITQSISAFLSRLSPVREFHRFIVMDNEEPVQTLAPVSFKKRQNKSKSIIRKREATHPKSDSDSGFTSSEDEEGRQIKRRRKTGGLVASSTQNNKVRTGPSETEPATAIVAPSNQDDATKISNWFEDSGKQKPGGTLAGDSIDGVTADGTYKGAANYQSFIQKNPDRAGKQVGPLKASSNVRTITVTDFAPDVCKDYKQTGFCGFGDNCKYLHAREDYKHGWQLDRDWEITTKGKKLSGTTVASANRGGQSTQDDDDDEALLESIPFACIICKKSYTSPIITKCGHYFCEACALKRYRKDPSCAACGSGTNGVFNTAKKLSRLLEKKREREKQKQEKEAELAVAP